MTISSSILVPLDGSAASALSLPCAAWLASRFGARLHVLSATDRPLPARDALAHLRVAEEYWPLVELHQIPASPDAAILTAIPTHGVRLVVMASRGAGAEDEAISGARGKAIGHIARAVTERCAVPVLLAPPHYREELPWRNVIVPLSGEVAGDDALAVAARLGARLDLGVRVIHVADANDAAKQENLASRMRYADALYHESSAQLEELVSRALPLLTPEESCRIQASSIQQGRVVDDLRALLEQPGNVLVAGWHGHLEPGRAPVLQALLPVVHSPILLVRSPPRPPFRLKVGEEFG